VEKFNFQKIKLELSPIPEVLVDCRSAQIEQVILNLLNNSADALTTLTDKWIRVDCLNLGEFVQIVVTDSGRGIAPPVVQKMMQPFFTTKEVGKGTGLGLSISVGIMEDHHGRLQYDASSPHTRFVMELPVKQI
jgi:C4-dicarboxylate-specific signal transduction histidine kinase